MSASGIIGGVVGAIIGLGGALLGAYLSVKNTQTPPERQFMRRLGATIGLVFGLWIGVPVALRMADILPQAIFWLITLPLYFTLGPVIQWSKRQQAAFRATDPHDEELPE